MADSGYAPPTPSARCVTHTHAKAVIFRESVLAGPTPVIREDACNNHTDTNTSTPSLTPDNSPSRSRRSSITSLFSAGSSTQFPRSSFSESLATKLQRSLHKLAHKRQEECSPLVEDSHVEEEEADHTIRVLPGAETFLKKLGPRYAIMCSGSTNEALECMSQAGITLDYKGVTVTAEDIDQSSRNTTATNGLTVGQAIDSVVAAVQSILAAAERMDRRLQDCIIVEDSPAGIRAARTTGAKVIAVCGRYSREELEKYRPHYVVDSLEDVSCKWVNRYDGLKAFAFYIYETGVGMKAK
ncbi:hypothetical protein D9758_009226 [Tetrapyrgos nigripes]|uniref:Uncharacterized protein n=1 Tax=Tetrapyrgos nigripes TaxID=182062 RepID=A0A8H5D322_9AGAR|nr:hypothetical protein D9758_009226 [Tetrapyrgos nigripes]